MATDAAVEEEKVSTKLEESEKIIKNNMIWSLGGSVIPIPLFDLAYISGIQLKLLNQLAKLYEVPFSKDIAKSIIASLISGLGSVSLSQSIGGSLLKMIPGVGHIASFFTLPLLAGGATFAVGKVFVQHFESGGTFLDFDPVKVKEYFAEQFEEGKKEAKKTKEKKESN